MPASRSIEEMAFSINASSHKCRASMPALERLSGYWRGRAWTRLQEAKHCRDAGVFREELRQTRIAAEHEAEERKLRRWE